MAYLKLKKILLIFFLIIQVCIGSQDFDVEIIKKDEGLSNSIITCGFNDSNGFVWFGTVNGLNRYDGKEFVVFKHNHEKTSISENKILSIAEDKKGFIWITTAIGGLDRLDPRTGKCKNFSLFDEVINAKSFISSSVFVNYDGKIMIIVVVSNHKIILKCFNALTNKVENYRTSNTNLDSILFKESFSQDYFISQDGVLIFKSIDIAKLFKSLIGPDHYKSYKLIALNTRDNTIKTISYSKDYKFEKFLGKDDSGNPLILLSGENNPFKVIKLTLKDFSISETDFGISKEWLSKNFNINAFYFENKMFALVKHRIENPRKKAKFGGLYQFNNSGFLEFNNRRQIYSLTGDYFGMSFHYTKRIFTPTNGIIWDYHLNGLIKIKPKIKKVQTFRYVRSDTNSLADKIIRSIYVDKNKDLWVGTFNGLNKYDAINQRWQTYVINNLNSDNLENIFNAITEDDFKNLILGTNKGIFLFNKKNGRFIDYSKKYIPIKYLDNFNIGSNIWGVLYDKNELWIGTLQGLSKTKYLSKTVKAYQASDAKTNSISSNGVYIIFKDKNNNIWMGTKSGLNRYVPELDGFKVYSHAHANRNSICGNNIWSICEDKKGNLWVGSYGAGINKFNPKTDDFTHFTMKEGLPDDGIVSMVCDNDNNLWLGSMNGLIKFDQKTNKFTRYSEKDGFQGDEYSFHSAAITHDNKLVFGGTNGLSMFSPNELHNNSNIPNIVISKLFFGDSLVSILLKDRDTIRKDWKTDYLKIQFSSMDFMSPLLNKYAFKIEGLHKDWIYLGNQNSIILAGIEPGEYTLRLKASNNDGIWNEKGIFIHLSIVPTFWSTGWFTAIVLSVIFILFISITGYFLWRSREKDLAKKRVISLQLKSLQAQMNPHFIFNSLNAILDLIVKKDLRKAMQYLTKFSKLLRKVIENSRESSVTLGEEIENIELYCELERLRYNNEFEFSINIDDEINTDVTVVPVLFLQTYIENAIKHGKIYQVENGKVEIKFKKSGEDLNIDITDNGIGRREHIEDDYIAKNAHKSFGMEISKDILNMLNSEISVNDLTDCNGLPIGTQIKIIIYNYKTFNG